MKAIIACGGMGTRLYPLTKVTNKHLLPVGREPMILRLVRQLMEVGVHEIGIGLNGPFTKGFYRLFDSHNNVVLLESNVVGGPGRTIFSFRDWIGKEDFLCLLGDTVFFNGFPDNLTTLESSGRKQWMCAMSLSDSFDKHNKYGQLILRDSMVERIVWKPSKKFSDIIQVPVYKFTPEVFDIIEHLDVTFGENREIHMTDIVNIFVYSKKMYALQLPDESYIDAGTHDALNTIYRKLYGFH